MVGGATKARAAVNTRKIDVAGTKRLPMEFIFIGYSPLVALF
jgi:hypothetical protein